MTNNPYAPPAAAWISLPEHRRASFIRKTYSHLLVAVLAFVAIDAAVIALVGADTLASLASAFGGYGWLGVLGLFMVVSWVATSMARSSTSAMTQYMGLGLYVVAEAVLFAPFMGIAAAYGGSDVLLTAAAITGFLFTAMTAFVLISGAKFRWLGGVLAVAGLGAMGAIVLSVFLGFSLGIWFTAGMIVFACASILYQTSGILHDYRESQHVAAALALFASVALLFWYVLQFVMASRD